MKVFLSYSRDDASVANAVAQDILGIDHEVWYDRDLTGGQAWWHAILSQIQECDLFIFVLTPASLESQACGLECGYAMSLRKRILPVLCAEGVKSNLLPPELSKIQFVDYRAQDKKAAFGLVKALTRLPEPEPLPNPLPAEPPIPMSYLSGLAVRIDAAGTLSAEDQSFLFLELKRGVKARETREDAVDLLVRMRRRNDLLANIAEEIDELLARQGKGTVRRDEPPAKPVASAGPVRHTAADPLPPLASSPPESPPDLPLNSALIAVSDTNAIDGVIRKAAATRDNWLLAAGEGRVAISMIEDQIVAMLAFKSWGTKQIQALKAMGWTLEGEFMRNVAACALGTLGVATYGIGFALLGHKGTREYLTKHAATKHFAPSQSFEAALNITQALRALAPDISHLTASNIGKTPLPE